VQAAIFVFGAAAQGDPAADQPVANVIGSFAQDPLFQAYKSANIDLDIPNLECSTIDYFNFLAISPEPFSTPGDAFLVNHGAYRTGVSAATGALGLARVPRPDQRAA